MNLEEARNNIGAEVEARGELKSELNKVNVHDILYIKSVDTHNKKVIIESNDGRTVAMVKKLQDIKLKPQNYKIHLKNKAESIEAQRLFSDIYYNFMIEEQKSDGILLFATKEREQWGFCADENENIAKAKQITIQDLRDMISSKNHIKHLEVETVVLDDAYAKEIGEEFMSLISNREMVFKPYKEMTFEDAYLSLLDNKDIEFLNLLSGKWRKLNQYTPLFVLENAKEFRLAPARIKLDGEYTKEELLQKIEEME